LNFNTVPDDVNNGLYTYVQVIIPQALPKSLTYRLTKEQEAIVVQGVRVLVPLGPRKMVTGVVSEIHQNAPKEYQAKFVSEVLDEQEVINPLQFKLMQWMAPYYVCSDGEVLNAFLPASLKLSSESYVIVYEGIEDLSALTEDEQLLYQIIAAKGAVKAYDLQDLLPEVSIGKILKTLSEQKIIAFTEKVKEKFQPKFVRKIGLKEKYWQDAEALTEVLERLNKAPKQQDALLTILNETLYQSQTSPLRYVPRKSIASLYGDGSVKALETKGILEEIQVEISRFGWENENYSDVDTRIVLSESQAKANEEILTAFHQTDTVLLHGVTGSGKTEIYLGLIHKALEVGTQVLLILPEIALTTQLIVRIRRVLGKQVALYHSRMNDAERAELYLDILNGKIQFVVGVRSALFLPFQNLSLIVVDEEHEPSYKQADPAPRYHGRDVALVLAKLHGAKVLLGSATPSFEAYYQTKIGKWALVNLTERFGNATMPEVEVIDIKPFKAKKEMKGSFSPPFLEILAETKQRGLQSIIFQNRRGYSPYVTCNICGDIPKCINCDVSLTQHLKQNILRCHYCGYSEMAPKVCKVCGSTEINSIGFGTERIEDELNLLLPELKLERMDLDTTRNKGDLESIIENIESGETDVLIGTQMVTKGFDFAKVITVGIFDIDRMIHIPDFRAAERCFQLVTQVAGRAGRRNLQGKLLIQTSNPNQPILSFIKTAQFQEFFELELAERERFHYPPFTRIIELSVRHEELMVSNKAAKQLANILKQNIGNERVLGPEAPAVSRIRNKYHFQILLKLEPGILNFAKIKQFIRQNIQQLIAENQYKKLQIVVNVDPQ